MNQRVSNSSSRRMRIEALKSKSDPSKRIHQTKIKLILDPEGMMKNNHHKVTKEIEININLKIEVK